MNQRLSFRIFAHSWTSDWNHGNAHFLRGLAQELTNLGHDVRCYEEAESWSRMNLREEGIETEARVVRGFQDAFPDLDVRTFQPGPLFGDFVDRELPGADIVLIHEWNRPETIRQILQRRERLGFRALFHDTHHRAYTNPSEIQKLNPAAFDGVLAFGNAIRDIYRNNFGVTRAWTFHEAADAVHFRPQPSTKQLDVVWVGNWGDEERAKELQEFLIEPAAKLKPKVAVHGVRYPQDAREKLAEAGIEYRGYLPNLEAPRTYAESMLTLHVPRRFYTNGLSGVPTIRVFETLACGIPLVCSPWTDTEGLFTAGDDYLCVENGQAMEAEIRHLLHDPQARSQLAENGRKTIERKHTCAHRAQQLLEICEELGK